MVLVEEMIKLWQEELSLIPESSTNLPQKLDLKPHIFLLDKLWILVTLLLDISTKDINSLFWQDSNTDQGLLEIGLPKGPIFSA